MNQLSLFEKTSISAEFAEYFFVIAPSQEITEKVAAIKSELHKKIDIGPVNLNSVAHISLLHTPVKDLSAGTLKSYAGRNFDEQKKFSVTMEKAGYFEHSFTKDIVLRFDQPQPVIRLAKRLHENLGLKFSPKNFTPHLTIARGISRADLAGFNSLHDCDLKAEFSCERVTILKREIQVYNGRIVKRSGYVVCDEIVFGKTGVQD